MADKLPLWAIEFLARVIHFFEGKPRRVWGTVGIGAVAIYLLSGFVSAWSGRETAPAAMRVTVFQPQEVIPAQQESPSEPIANSQLDPAIAAPGGNSADLESTDIEDTHAELEAAVLEPPSGAPNPRMIAVSTPTTAVAGTQAWLQLEKALKRPVEKFIASSDAEGRLIAYYPSAVDGTEYAVKVVDGRTGETRALLHTAEPKAGINMMPNLAFSPEGDWLAVVLDEQAGGMVSDSAIVSRIVRVFDTQTWQQTAYIKGPTRIYRDIRVANATAWSFSDSSDRIAVAFGATIRVFDAKSGEQQSEATSDGYETVQCLAWLADDARLAAGDDKGWLRVINPDDGAVEQSVSGLGDLQALKVTPNGLLIVDAMHGFAGNQQYDKTCWQLTLDGRVQERLWTRTDVALRGDGKVFMAREEVSLPGPPAHRQGVPAYVFYDAAAQDEWWNMVPQSRRLLEVSGHDAFQLQYVGDYLVARCDYGQFLAVNREERSAVVLGDLRMVEPPRFVPSSSIEDFGSMIVNLGGRGMGQTVIGSPGQSSPAEWIVNIFPVGDDRVLVCRTEGQVELVHLPPAIEQAKLRPKNVVEIAAEEERVWRDADGWEFLGRLMSLEDGVVAFSVRQARGKRETFSVDLLRLHTDEIRAIARKHFLQEKRPWHVLGQAPFEGWLREFNPPYVTIEVEQQEANRRLRIAIASLNSGEYSYLHWLEAEARSRLLGRVEQWQVETSILDRMKSEEQTLQGVWRITAGYDADHQPDDRYVMFLGDQMYLPSVVRGQVTRWRPQRFVCDPDAKPYAILDRYEDGTLHTSIYQRRGDALMLEFGFLSRRPQAFQAPWTLQRVSDAEAEELMGLLR